MSITEISRELLEAGGTRTRGMNPFELTGLALKPRQRAGEATSTSDLVVVLEAVCNKVMLGAYAQADQTWRRVAGVKFVKDFKPSNFYRQGSLDVLGVVGAGGEVESIKVPDALKFAAGLETRANRLGVTRNVILADDLGALENMAVKAGHMAALSVEKAVFDLLNTAGGLGPTITLAGVSAPLFDDAAWGNVSPSAAITPASLQADRVLLAKQKDPSNGQVLNIRPQILLCSMELEAEANAANAARFDSSDNPDSPRFTGGLFRDVVASPRLTNISRRYLLADPQLAPSLLVTFLQSQGDVPRLEQRDSWSFDGQEFRVIFDFLAQGFDPRPAITNAGT